MDDTAIKSNKALWFGVEACASICNIAGIYIGSTTMLGAMWYGIALIFWYALTIKKKLWGLMPLNIAVTIVTILNIWKAFYS